MKRQYCRVCGQEIDRDAIRCPHCGSRTEPVVPRLWILVFFVVGVVIGLMLLILQGSLPLSWLASTPAPIAEVAPQRPSAVLPEGRIRGDKVRTWSPRTDPASPPTSTRPPSEPKQAMSEPIDCNREKALAVRDKARSLAVFSEQPDHLQLRLGDDWAYYSAGHRRSFVEVFSKADRCLQGRWRDIRFTFRGEEVATLSAAGVVEMK